jgi:hypothetical protein
MAQAKNGPGLKEFIDQKTGKYRLSSTCYSSPIPWNPTNYRNLWISEQGTFNVQENCELQQFTWNLPGLREITSEAESCLLSYITVHGTCQ